MKPSLAPSPHSPVGDDLKAPAAAPIVGEASAQRHTAGDRDFPIIPQIIIPDIIGVTPAQRALEASMQDIIDPLNRISVRPASCRADGALISDAGATSIDEHGNLTRNDNNGVFDISRAWSPVDIRALTAPEVLRCANDLRPAHPRARLGCVGTHRCDEGGRVVP
ncbi:MAG: hypothetical protein ACTS5I_01505 [Rhodanobacter sp.]